MPDKLAPRLAEQAWQADAHRKPREEKNEGTGNNNMVKA